MGRVGGAPRRQRPSGATSVVSQAGPHACVRSRSGAQEVGWAWGAGVLAFGLGVFPGAGFGGKCHRYAITISW